MLGISHFSCVGLYSGRVYYVCVGEKKSHIFWQVFFFFWMFGTCHDLNLLSWGYTHHLIMIYQYTRANIPLVIWSCRTIPQWIIYLSILNWVTILKWLSNDSIDPELVTDKKGWSAGGTEACPLVIHTSIEHSKHYTNLFKTCRPRYVFFLINIFLLPYFRNLLTCRLSLVNCHRAISRYGESKLILLQHSLWTNFTPYSSYMLAKIRSYCINAQRM